MRSMLLHPALIPAVLNGTKRRTRRLVQLSAIAAEDAPVLLSSSIDPETGRVMFGDAPYPETMAREEVRAAYLPDERIYVREPWRPRPLDGADGLGVLIDYRIAPETRHVVDPQALADWRWPAAARRGEGWCSPLIMPAAAARAELRIDLVRVERLQAITEDEARLEGLPFQVEPAMVEWNAHTGDSDPPGVWVGPSRLRRLTRGRRLTEEVYHHHTAREAFADWWDGLAEEADRRRPRDPSSGERVGAPAPRWADDPWVFVYGFTCQPRTA